MPPCRPNYSQLHHALNLTALLAGQPGVGWVLQPQPAHAKGLAGGSACVWMEEHMYCVAGGLHPEQVRTPYSSTPGQGMAPAGETCRQRTSHTRPLPASAAGCCFAPA